MNTELNTVQTIFDAVVHLQNDHANEYNSLLAEHETLKSNFANMDACNHELELRLSAARLKIETIAKQGFNAICDRDEAYEKLDKLRMDADSSKLHFSEIEHRNAAMNLLVVKQKQDLESLLHKHNTEVTKANTAIQSLQRQLDNANKALKMAKCKKDKAAAGREVIWQQGAEKLRNSQIIKATVDGKASNTATAVWWEHERGFQLMCVYDMSLDKVMICDPRNESDEMILPSDSAIAQIKAMFRKSSVKKVS